MRRNMWLATVTIALLLASCGPKEYKSLGDKYIVIFDNEHLYFAPGEFDAPIDGSTDATYRLVDGRVLMKRITLPTYFRETEATVKVTVASAGDRWDKSGSCFVVPAGADINFIDIHNGKAQLPAPLSGHESLKGIASSKGYVPVVELMRFMTPFGIGYYNDKMNDRQPVYIPQWEEKAVWEQDITDRISMLEGDVWIGIWIDTWTAEGYTVSAELDFKESPHSFAGKQKTQVLPLVNTIYYMGGMIHPDIFSRQDLEIKASIPANARNVKLSYITTGHGGHSGGDEFVQKRNIVLVDNKEVINFIPWRDDCASFRRFNPGSGVWLRQDTAEYISFKTGKYEKKVIEERLASSDLSRSNWCPGSDVIPETVMLGNITGEHTFTFSIPEAQQADGDKLNHWLISAFLSWEE